MKYLFLLLSLSFLITACSDKDNASPSDPNDPMDLELNFLVYENGSGIVVITATATNATEYHFYMGDDDNEAIVLNDGTYEHTYVSSGSYLVEVRAYGASGRYLKKTKRIIVPAEDPVNVGQGYSTPFSYDGMELVWNDEFFGSTLNEEDWSHDIGNGCPDLCGWGNNELEYYRPENTWVENGVLTLEARKENFEGSAYTSGKIVTRNKQAFQYGRIDIRATLPKGQGIWPALWMLGTNQPIVGWPKCGEIDIMEMIGGNGRENRVSGNAFWDNNGVTDDPKLYTLDSGIFADEYHVFSITWDELEICWFVDDVMYHNLDISPAARSEFQNPFYLIFNVAVGGNWPGNPDATTAFPTSMKVDYVRVFKSL